MHSLAALRRLKLRKGKPSLRRQPNSRARRTYHHWLLHCACVLVLPNSGQAVTPRIALLPVSDCYAISSDGKITGVLHNHAFLYTAGFSNGPFYDLGVLGGSLNASGGGGINSSSQVVGRSSFDGAGVSDAFLYDGMPGAGGKMVDITPNNGGGVATGINDAGVVVGYRLKSPGTKAFIYKNGITFDLGTMGGNSSFGNAINSAGQVTGWADTASGISQHAFLYSGTPNINGVMSDLGTLGGKFSEGVDINDAGHVVGISYTAGDIERHAFLYTGIPGVDGKMHDLGTLGGTESFAAGINSSSQIVGMSFMPDAYRYTADVEHAFLYVGTPGVDGHMIDLNAWLKANNPIDGARWWLLNVRGISDNGLVIGNGYYDADNNGFPDYVSPFLLDISSIVPEPSSIALLIVGILGTVACSLTGRFFVQHAEQAP